MVYPANKITTEYEAAQMTPKFIMWHEGIYTCILYIVLSILKIVVKLGLHKGAFRGDGYES